MKIVRKVLLSILAGSALTVAATAFAENGRRDVPRDARDAPPPVLFAPPMYFGPAYSAAAVYDFLRSPQGVSEANTPHGASPRAGKRLTPAMVGRVGLEPTTKGL
jgi:hypothetical protein